MRNLKAIIPNVIATPDHYASEHKPGPSIDEASAKVIEKLFNELKSIFPAWRHAWPNDKAENNAKRTWTKAFIAARLSSIEQIRYGIEKSRRSGSPFMPSIGEFIQWCHLSAEDLGLPSADRAYAMAAMIAHPTADRSKCIPAVYHAAVETGFYALSSNSEDKTRRRFERNYSDALRIVAAGGELHQMPVPPERMITAKPTEESRSRGRAVLDMLRNRKRATA